MTVSLVQGASGLDPTFGKQGVVTTSFNPGDFAHAIAMQGTKRIIVVGSTIVSGKSHFAVAAYKPNGTLDGFGGGGKVVTPLGTGDSRARAVAVQPDGCVVVVGTSRVGTDDKFAAVRYTANGNLDPSFGSGGKVLILLKPGQSSAEAVAIQPDGRIVMIGTRFVGQPGNEVGDFAAVRLHKNGKLDTSFGNGGIVTTNVGQFSDLGMAMVIQPDQKIVVAGSSGDMPGNKYAYSMVRYWPSGKLDYKFGSAGKVITAFGNYLTRLRSVRLDSAGRIVVSGIGEGDGNSQNVSIRRFLTNGAHDTAFGSQGKVDLFTTNDYAKGAMALTANNRIVIAGCSDPVQTGFGITGFNAGGPLIGSYATNGPIAQYSDEAEAVMIQPDGKVLVTGHVNFGYTGGATGDDFALARYNVNW